VAIRITVWIQGLFFGFVTIGRYGKWYQPTALRDGAGIAVATMTSLRHRPTTDSGANIATPVRRALAEVCTAPMLLVLFAFGLGFEYFLNLLFGFGSGSS